MGVSHRKISMVSVHTNVINLTNTKFQLTNRIQPTKQIASDTHDLNNQFLVFE